jgi:hypothetical protein
VFINLHDIMDYFDQFDSIPDISPDMIEVNEIVNSVKDLRCWIKHFYAKSSIPELSRIKALQRCMNFLLRILKICWRDYFYDPESPDEGDEEYVQLAAPTYQRRMDYKVIIKAILQLFDWVCLNNKFIFIFNEECGRTNVRYLINMTNRVLGQFRRPAAFFKSDMVMPNTEDLTFNKKVNRKE